MIITPTIALIAFLVLILLAIIIALNYRKEDYDQSRARVFVSVLTGLSMFITFLFYYSVVDLQQQERILPRLAELSRLADNAHHRLTRTLIDASTVVPSFISSLRPLEILQSPNLVEPQIVISLICQQIFHCWQDVVESSILTSTDLAPYIYVFLQQAHSSNLRCCWQSSRAGYSVMTRTFGDDLIEVSTVLPLTATAFEKAAVDIASRWR